MTTNNKTSHRDFGYQPKRLASIGNLRNLYDCVRCEFGLSDTLQIEDVDAGYGKSQVLFSVSAEVKAKSICAVLGPNGSGKSTLLKTLFGLTTIYKGKIRFNGLDITGRKAHEIARMGLAYLPQTENVYANLNVRENLIMAGYTVPNDKINERIEDVLRIFPLLQPFLERKASTLSGGERQILVMATALMRRPSLMLFDEPSSNLAPKMVEQIFEKIKELNHNLGITVIVAEQNTKKALELSDDAYLLVSGRVNFHGGAKELAANNEFGRLFLGL
jgi:branched-chain amino acid transport system ATP-binding protein